MTEGEQSRPARAQAASQRASEATEQVTHTEHRTVPWFLHPVVLALLVFLGAAAFHAYTLYVAIVNSTSSTAAIGFLFLPFIAVVWAVPWALVGLGAGFSIRAVVFRTRASLLAAAFTGVVALWYPLHAVRAQIHDDAVAEVVQDVRGMTRSEIDAWRAGDPELLRDPYVLAAIAANEATSPETLAWIASLDDPALHQAQGHIRPDITGDNRHGLAVMRLVARNPAVTPEILAHLAESPVDYVQYDVASNRKTPEAALESLYARSEGAPLVRTALRENPRTPARIRESLGAR